MDEDGTKYGTDFEKYCISGKVFLKELPEHPHPIPNYHLSATYAKEQKAEGLRFQQENWVPTMARNRLTAKVTTDTWMTISRRDHVLLEDGRCYPLLSIPKDTTLKIEKGAALLAVLRSQPGEGSLVGDSKREPRWCIVDFLLTGEPRMCSQASSDV